MKAGVLISWGTSFFFGQKQPKDDFRTDFLSTSTVYILPLNMQGRELLGKQGRLPKMPKKFLFA